MYSTSHFPRVTARPAYLIRQVYKFGSLNIVYCNCEMENFRKFCPHCGQTLAPRTFREHHRLFYDAVSCTWTKKRRVNSHDEQAVESYPHGGVEGDSHAEVSLR